jgi:hypothetical protein
MGFLDKVKTGAEQAATRAKDEAKEFQLKREVAQANAVLGRQTLELLDAGEIANERLTEAAQRARSARSELEAHERDRAARMSTDEGESPGENSGPKPGLPES